VRVRTVFVGALTLERAGLGRDPDSKPAPASTARFRGRTRFEKNFRGWPHRRPESQHGDSDPRPECVRALSPRVGCRSIEDERSSAAPSCILGAERRLNRGSGGEMRDHAAIVRAARSTRGRREDWRSGVEEFETYYGKVEHEAECRAGRQHGGAIAPSGGKHLEGPPPARRPIAAAAGHEFTERMAAAGGAQSSVATIIPGPRRRRQLETMTTGRPPGSRDTATAAAVNVGAKKLHGR